MVVTSVSGKDETGFVKVLTMLDVSHMNNMVDTFATGVDGWVPKDDLVTVVRSALLDNLFQILHPNATEQYFVILGEKGVGKSTAVRQTIKQLEDPRGVIYIMAPSADTPGKHT